MSLYEDQDKAPVEDPTGGTPASSQGEPNPLDQMLAGIKNENGEQKYASVEEALKGLANAQSHIKTLEQEHAELRSTLKSQEDLAQLLENNKPKEETQEQQTQQPAQPTLTAEDVVQLLENREKAKVGNSNLDKVKEAMKQKYGVEYSKVLSSKTDELGLTPELVDNMAKTSPDALLKLFGVEASTPKPSMSGGANTQSFSKQPEPPKKFDPFSSPSSPEVEKWLEVSNRVAAQIEDGSYQR
jgi:hypothetical protein